MQHKPVLFAAAAAATLSALLLTGSTSIPPSAISPEARIVSAAGAKLFSSGHYSEARPLFLRAAAIAQPAGDTHANSMNWNNAGVCWMLDLQFRSAITAFGKARTIAEDSRDPAALAMALSNLANLYIHMSEPEQALRAARTAIDGPAKLPFVAKLYGPQIRMQSAMALVGLHRYEDALPIYRNAIADLIRQNNFTDAARALSSLGDESLKANRLDNAQEALAEGLRLVRDKKADAAASMFSGEAKLLARQGRYSEAAVLFDRSLAVPPGVTPQWKLIADRAQFRLERNGLRAAFDDFLLARTIAAKLRLEVVPADQDRVQLESGLSDIIEGLVEAGNRLALESGDEAVLKQTFDAAEQDRQWSLRALLPAADDWRSRLPEHYWDLLARYQRLERSANAQHSPDAERQLTAADDELKRIEAEAGRAPAGEAAGSAFTHLQTSIGADTVLFSFHLSARSSWLWATDRAGTQVFRLPARTQIEEQASRFRKTLSPEAARTLYQTLFAAVPRRFTSEQHWLLEPDGPLYETPFAALIVSGPADQPEFLVEKTAVQILPGALLLKSEGAPVAGPLLAVGDAIYNGADPRYHGERPQAALPRLTNTAAELEACSRAWGVGRSRLLSGGAATPESVRAALNQDPAIVHFATHVVPSPREFRTGLIALSLQPNGAMGMMGPREIVARPVRASLIVMDGCHSTQAQALPGAGLMGLTRAWIGAGAGAVLATQWDIPDEDSQLMMESFYRALASRPAAGAAAALRRAQLAQLSRPGARENPAHWAGYSVESRNP